jgi:hypothetical protein
MIRWALPGFLAACIAAAIAACAPASLGSPTSNERILHCRTGEVVVCRSRYPSRLPKDETKEYDFCTCESTVNGIPL